MPLHRTLTCIPIVGPSIKTAREQLHEAELIQADLVEIRVDLIQNISLEEMNELRKERSIPWLITVRSQHQGGRFAEGKQALYQLREACCSLTPAYLDVEADSSIEHMRQLRSLSPQTKLVLSWHVGRQTPLHLSSFIEQMRKLPADIYKLVTHARTTMDALRLLEAVYTTKQNDWIGVATGTAGELTRLAGPSLRSPFLFASLKKGAESAFGQMNWGTLRDVYRLQEIEAGASLFGLLGDPVDKSHSHQTHNRVLRALQYNAVYVKMRISPSELAQATKYLRRLPFKGLSITMPLKEAILPLLDHVDRAANCSGAVNTVVVEGNRLLGYNTDGLGALRAIVDGLKRPVVGMRICVVGAGATGRAIAWEAQSQGATVILCNRSEEKGLRAASRLGCSFQPWDKLPSLLSSGCDIVVQATPVGMSPFTTCPFDPSHLQPETLVLDVVSNPKVTALLKAAAEKGCRTVSGQEMFFHQAVLQFQHWLNKVDGEGDLLSIMREALR